jgi:hypothetical protein
VTSTAHLAVVDRTRSGSDRDAPDHPSVRTIGAARPSAVRALLTRSITMTAFEIERRIRIRRRRPSTRALQLPTLASWQRRHADRARHELHAAEAVALRSLPSIR